MRADLGNVLSRVREKKPLIHHITNWVTIYDAAALTRAFGALPVMAHAVEESADMTAISDALVLNIGTLTSPVFEAMLKSANAAKKKGIPIVLDAVGAGATKFRTEKSLKLLSCGVDVVKGNAGEIASLCGYKAKVRGVESVHADSPIEAAFKLAGKYRCVVVITGREDVVVGSEGMYIVKNGHEMMGRVVGTGCMAASSIGVFAAVEKDLLKACAYALSCFCIAGELAAKKSSGPMEFKNRIIDEVYRLDGRKAGRMAKIEWQERE
ncbi:MAG: hydroxyethylthiazole kinase [Candidatus Micrarchaeia archaeon]